MQQVYETAMEMLERDGFNWRKLREYFPFGEIRLREANYQRLVEKALECLVKIEEKERLLDLLDAQACVFLEQVWVQNELLEAAGEEPFEIEGHFASAWLQINSNLRFTLGLPEKDSRHAMFGLSASESLIDRIISVHPKT